MKNQKLKDFLLILSVLFFIGLSLTLFIKNIFSQWLLSSYWTIAPQSILKVQNVKISSIEEKNNSFKIESLPNNEPIFKEDLEEYPLPVAFEEKFIVQESIPLEDTLGKPNHIETKLYFIKLNSDGHLFLAGLPRKINFDNTPLTETLKALLEGPNREEQANNYLSLIPPEAKILSLSLQEDTLILDVNEAFAFNSLGIEGIVNQIKQIVYTVTEFSTVKQVQFLIEGEIVEFLTAEGPYLGKPITRRSLN